MEYRVLAALRDEMNQGWVWVTNAGFDARSVVKITNLKNKKVIYCECLEIEENYKIAYNQPPRVDIDDEKPTVIINAWYRSKLGGIATKTNHELDIRSANNPWGKLWANFQHPQVVVRMAIWLAVISVALGIIGVCISIKT